MIRLITTGLVQRSNRKVQRKKLTHRVASTWRSTNKALFIVNKLGFNPNVELLRQRTKEYASSMATNSMNAMIRTLTNSFIEQMTVREQQLTELFLVDLLSSMIEHGKTFIEVFGSRVFDVKVPNLRHSAEMVPNKEKQYILD